MLNKVRLLILVVVTQVISPAILTGAAIFLSFNEAARSQELPLKDPKKLPGPAAKEKALRNLSAKVVWADYPLIRHDFPFLKNKTEKQIDKWLEKNNVISEGQVKQTEFNTKIKTAPFPGKVIRPKDYNRALVADVETLPNGDHVLIDEKGGGTKNPRYDWEDGDPRDGTYSLGAAMRESLWTTAVELVLKHSQLKKNGKPIIPVKNYAVLYAGFYIKVRNKEHEEVDRNPWGYLYRQAQTRFEDPDAPIYADQGKYYTWNQKDSLLVETVLREYGITSEGAGRKRAKEGGINIQGTKGNAILDFGNYMAFDRFLRHNVFHWDGTVPLIVPGKKFIQPNPDLKIPTEQWGTFEDGEVDSQDDKPWNHSVDTAEYVAEQMDAGNYEAAREAYTELRRAMLEPFYQKLGMIYPDGGQTTYRSCKATFSK